MRREIGFIKTALFPSLKRRGGCEDEVRADGVVSSAKVSAELTTPARQPAGCRATPPFQGGEK